jgi:hypothetical protein
MHVEICARATPRRCHANRDELLVAYRREAKLFTNAALNIPGVQGGDSEVTTQELDPLSQKCRAANYALLAHLYWEHGEP